MAKKSVKKAKKRAQAEPIVHNSKVDGLTVRKDPDAGTYAVYEGENPIALNMNKDLAEKYIDDMVNGRLKGPPPVDPADYPPEHGDPNA